MGEQLKTLKYIHGACEVVNTRRAEREKENTINLEKCSQTALFSSETIHKFIDEEEQTR